MPKPIKTSLFIIQQKVKIFMLKNKIKKIERMSYLNLWERIELREAMRSLQNLERQQIHNTAMFSVY